MTRSFKNRSNENHYESSEIDTDEIIQASNGMY